MWVDVWKWERGFTSFAGNFTSSLQGVSWIYSTKVSLIILTKTSIQAISAEGWALLSFVAQQGLTHSLVAVYSKKEQ